MSARGTAPAAPPAAAFPADARVIAARLAGLFEADQKIVVALDDAHRRLAAANDQLWTDPVVDRLSVHGQIHRAFCAYQHASERAASSPSTSASSPNNSPTRSPPPAITASRPRSANVHELAAGTLEPAEQREGDATMSAPAKIQALEALVEAHARELHLPAIRTRFRALAAEALREQQTPLAYLAALLEAEVTERAERREKRRLLDARFPLIKRLEDFRFDDNPKVPQATIAALAEGSWIDDRESVILIGESGTGKTMLATALAVCACQQGRRVRFTTLAGLATELQEADSRKELARVVGRYSRIEVLLLDELGYLALPDGAAELVFQVISERNERGSLIVTTNLPFGEWTKVFPDARLAKAVVDRITHKAHIIDTGTESWRFRHGLDRKRGAKA